MHALHLFSPADASLGQSTSFDLAIASASLLGVGWQGGSSSHKFTCPLARLASALGFFYGVRSPTP